jgi:hypothetical protein
MFAQIFKFPRRRSHHRQIWTPERRAAVSAAARRPRRSKNGTPEERAAKVAQAVSAINSDGGGFDRRVAPATSAGAFLCAIATRMRYKPWYMAIYPTSNGTLLSRRS